MSNNNGFALEVGPRDSSGRSVVVALLGKVRHVDIHAR
jgi:hypothetical protein